MIAFIDDHRSVYGVEPICRVLPIAPSTYHARKAEETEPERIPRRRRRDAELRERIRSVWDENFQVYGARKVWRQLQREAEEVARCTVERLMRDLGIQGAVRGKAPVTTTPDTSAPCPQDLVQRQFSASRPDQLWVADFTYVPTWRGHVYVAFVTDVFSRRIVGWRAASTMRTDLPLDALEQALYERGCNQRGGLIHHSDRGSPYVSIRYSERLAAAGIEASVGSVGDSYDNALAESVFGLFKAELIWRRGPWRCLQDVEHATLTWVHWYNHQRLHESIGYVPPSEYERMFETARQALATAA
jgi:transposase InsO family protein